VTVTEQLKVVRLPVFDAAVNISVLELIDCSEDSVLLVHVRVSEELALPGFQLFTVIVSVSETVPVS